MRRVDEWMVEYWLSDDFAQLAIRIQQQHHATNA
jgi:hypothetical protein